MYDFLTFDNKEYIPFAAYGNNWERTVTLYSGGKLLNATGWKVGWIIGPADMTKQASLIHESSVFNLNVPGQVAIANSMADLHLPHEGYSNYREYVSKTFEETRN